MIQELEAVAAESGEQVVAMRLQISAMEGTVESAERERR